MPVGRPNSCPEYIFRHSEHSITPLDWIAPDGTSLPFQAFEIYNEGDVIDVYSIIRANHRGHIEVRAFIPLCGTCMYHTAVLTIMIFSISCMHVPISPTQQMNASETIHSSLLKIHFTEPRKIQTAITLTEPILLLADVSEVEHTICLCYPLCLGLDHYLSMHVYFYLLFMCSLRLSVHVMYVLMYSSRVCTFFVCRWKPAPRLTPNYDNVEIPYGNGELYVHQFKLPEGIVGDVLLQWYWITANGCRAPGYENYYTMQTIFDKPSGSLTNTCTLPYADCSREPDYEDICRDPQIFRNCAEVTILPNGPPAPTPEPSARPSLRPSVSSSPASQPSERPSALPTISTMQRTSSAIYVLTGTALQVLWSVCGTLAGMSPDCKVSVSPDKRRRSSNPLLLLRTMHSAAPQHPLLFNQQPAIFYPPPVIVSSQTTILLWWGASRYLEIWKSGN